MSRVYCVASVQVTMELQSIFFNRHVLLYPAHLLAFLFTQRHDLTVELRS